MMGKECTIFVIPDPVPHHVARNPVSLHRVKAKSVPYQRKCCDMGSGAERVLKQAGNIAPSGRSGWGVALFGCIWGIGRSLRAAAGCFRVERQRKALLRNLGCCTLPLLCSGDDLQCSHLSVLGPSGPSCFARRPSRACTACHMGPVVAQQA